MQNVNMHGKPPYYIVVIHGGPGAAGEMTPVARELATDYGIVEPHQTALSIEGQVEELKRVLENQATRPVILIGYSWGAWLSFILAAQYPELVKKLILVSSGPFEDSYRQGSQQIRLSRLTKAEQAEFERLGNLLGAPGDDDKNKLLARLGALALKSDTYDAIEDEDKDSEHLDARADIFLAIWPEAAEMRRSGKLLALAKQIACPVIAIHGDYDSHSADGVREPLSKALADFRLILLKQSGHKPWIEKHAKHEFYEILREAVNL